LQAKVGAQSPGSAHVCLQAALPSQAYGVQSVIWEVHCPPAPHLKVVSIDAEQVGGPQVVPTG
jgi:hypothetical protein